VSDSNELSISFQAVKTKVYRLIDALVEGKKTPEQVEDAVGRWWESIHPVDRPVARKYLLTVLAKSDAAINAIESRSDEAATGLRPLARRSALSDARAQAAM
jgi:hypothetical protein